MISNFVKSAFGALVGGGVLLSAGAAHAQANPQVKAPLAVKIGAYIPISSSVRNITGDVLPIVEAEYTIQDLFVTNGATTISVGYAERKGLRLIPVLLTESYHFRSRGADSGITVVKGEIDTYAGLGIGIYNTRFPTSGGSDSSKNLFGGCAVFGLNVSNGVFVEGKFHLVSRYNDLDISGIQLAAGIRF